MARYETRPRRGGRKAALQLPVVLRSRKEPGLPNEKRGKRALKLSGPFFVVLQATKCRSRASSVPIRRFAAKRAHDLFAAGGNQGRRVPVQNTHKILDSHYKLNNHEGRTWRRRYRGELLPRAI